ncbi:MAG TPA: hypothetical protein VJ553_00985 [Candidatus Paceibacterota bacterium]|nr:hypothetical protein [Candidatus Paceibacterota bacterium]
MKIIDFIRTKKQPGDPRLDGTLAMKGMLSAKVLRKDGSTEDLGVICKEKVTQAFAAYLVNALVSGSGTYPMDVFIYHDCGTGTTAEANTQTALVTPYGGARTAGTKVVASAYVYRSVGTISFSGTFAITEHGLFSAAAAGTMMDRSLFAAINVVSGDGIQFTYELTVTPEA